MTDEGRFVYVDLTGADRKQVHHALLEAFDRAALAEMLAFDLDQRLEAIASGGSLSEVVLSLIGWAEQQGRVLQLLKAAQNQRPGNDVVAAALQVVEARAAAEKAKPKREPVVPDAGDQDEEPDTPPRKRKLKPKPAPDPAPGWDFNPNVFKAPGPVVPGAPTAALGPIVFTHNLPMVPHPQGLAAGIGMSIAMTGMLSHVAGRTMQLVVRFVFPNGAMLYAAPQERTFRDPTGYCAVATMPLPAPADTVQLDGYVLTLPYYVLNLVQTGGMMVYQISAVGTVYVDNAPIAQSVPTPFQVRW